MEENNREYIRENISADIFVDSTELCSNILTIQSFHHEIEIIFRSNLTTTTATDLINSLSLNTSWLTEPIFFPPSSSKILSLNPHNARILFWLPVVASYNSTLLCLDKYNHEYKSISQCQTHIRSSFPVFLELKEFINNQPTTNLSTYSQFKCHHNDWRQRWCEARNIAIIDHHIFSFSPAFFNFPSPFIVPGCRAPPFDKAVDRLQNEPIVSRLLPSEIPRVQFEIISDPSSITGVFHNFFMMWHAVFDFMVPLYHFLNIFLKYSNRFNRRLFIRSDGVWTFTILLQLFSTKPTIILDENSQNFYFSQAIIGVERDDNNLNLDQGFDQAIGHNYTFDRSTAPGFREEALEVLHFNDSDSNRPKRPLVLIIKRGTKRDIMNIPSIKKAVKETCSICNVEIVQMQDLSFENQIKRVAPATVLIGNHGSGLVHTLWLKESRKNFPTYEIEVLPYNYTCRDWYHQAANVAGAQYRSVMNKHPPSLEGLNVDLQNNLKFCWSHPEDCTTQTCHDALRDQATIVEVDTFLEVWKPVAQEIIDAFSKNV